MSNEELKRHMQILVNELNKRTANKDISVKAGICQDLFAVQNAVQQALIDNNCLPL